MSLHDHWTHTLLDPAQPCPPGMTTWNGSAVDQRFAVYRNNVMVSLIDALADTFPVVFQLVGADFFSGDGPGVHSSRSAAKPSVGAVRPDVSDLPRDIPTHV